MGYDESGDGYNSDGTVWNIDDKVQSLMFDLKESFVINLRNWDLENAYWDIITLGMEADALLDETDQKDLDKKLSALSDYRTKYNQIHEANPDKKGEYYSKLIEIYKDVCRKVVEQELYFRKKKKFLGL